MDFLYPGAFYFAAALPVVILFYLLKRRRVVKLVSSTLLWQRFLAEQQASAPFQRLRHNWLLLLQLLLLLCVILALSRPFRAGPAITPRLRVVILDTSASMQATDEKPSRFEKARSEALKWVDGLKDEDQMVVLSAGVRTEVLQSPTSGKATLRRALQQATVTDGATRLNEALKLAETLVRDQKDAEIHLFSDGGVATLADFENKNLPLIYHRVGSASANLGVVSLDVRANPDEASQRAIFASVANSGSEEKGVDVELRFGEGLVEVRRLVVPPTNTASLVFVTSQTTNGVFTVRLNATGEPLSADDQASIYSALPQPVNVWLVTRGNRFLEKSLRGSGPMRLTVVNSLTSDPGADVVVLDDVEPTVWPAANVLAFHVARTNWFPNLTRLENPALVDWKTAHPVLRHVNLDNVQVAESHGVAPVAWGATIVESPSGALLVAGELERRRIVWVGFDPLQSTWPLRVSFPIFVANAVDWLNPAGLESSLRLVRSGEPFRYLPPAPVSSATLVHPDGSRTVVPVDTAAAEIVAGDTLRQGIYRLQAGTNEVVFCVNLLDAAESQIRPREELSLGAFGTVNASTVKRANMEIWRWIAGIALAVLLFEWWFYHRRSA